jgi:hypothetical protein
VLPKNVLEKRSHFLEKIGTEVDYCAGQAGGQDQASACADA